MDGQGTYYYASGDIYSGSFREGKKHGSGMYHFKVTLQRVLGLKCAALVAVAAAVRCTLGELVVFTSTWV